MKQRSQVGVIPRIDKRDKNDSNSFVESVETPTVDSQAQSGTDAPVESSEACLRKLWKVSLLVQGRVDSRSGVVGDGEGRDIGVRLIDLAVEMLGTDDLKYAQSLLIRGASLKSKKQDQQLFPSVILNKCFFKSRGGALRSGQGYGEEAASYAASEDSAESGSGTKQFGQDFAEHLNSLKGKLSGEPDKDDGKAIEELALYSLSHVTTIFKDDVRQLAREAKPFEIAARTVSSAFQSGPGLKAPFDGDSVLQAYCGSVLNRLESIEKLGAKKSSKLFNKYLSSLDKEGAGISVEKILGDHSLGSFPEFHHLPAAEFVTLAGGDGEGGAGVEFLGLVSKVAKEVSLSSRELLRFDAYTNLHFSQEFQIKEDETAMEPVKHCAATRLLMSSYRQVREHLVELGIGGSPAQHYFGWYSIPRVMEAFLIGESETLEVTGCVPLGLDQDPWSEDLFDLRMEYRLAKVQRTYYEPPLTTVVPSALVYLTWEIAALGVAPESIKLEASDESAGSLTLSFELANADKPDEATRRQITYTTADIEVAQPADLKLPQETDPVLFQCLESGMPAALLFVGDNVVKELPLYQRFSYGKNVALYVLETKIAPKVRREKKVPEKSGAKKAPAKAANEVPAAPVLPPEPELEGLAKLAQELLKADQDLHVLQQEAFAWTREVLERVVGGDKVTGKLRRNFRRLHNQLKHQERRGHSNRLEGEFMSKLSELSRQFDVEESEGS